MPVIALQGLRGGTETTSLAAALAWALSELDETVLALDFSPANQLRMHFNTPLTLPRGWMRALLDGADWRSGAMRYRAGLDYLPFGQLSDAERRLFTAQMFDGQTDPRLRFWPQALTALKRDYRWLLLDVPAEESEFTRQTTALADRVILVTVADANCHLRLQQRPRDDRTLFLLNQFIPVSQAQQDLHHVWLDARAPLIPQLIHRDEALAEAPLAKQPLGEYRRQSLCADEVATLASWLLIHLGEKPL